jgi:hypothetical protein
MPERLKFVKWLKNSLRFNIGILLSNTKKGGKNPLFAFKI